VGKAISAWASAWSRKDVKGYLAQYAADFKTPKGASRKAWEDEREDRIAGKPGKISVSYDEPQISINGDRATAKFRQHYKSSSLSGSTNKTLVLVRAGNRWLIQEENAR
jgi:ketosteroid isomerase-like protein